MNKFLNATITIDLISFKYYYWNCWWCDNSNNSNNNDNINIIIIINIT